MALILETGYHDMIRNMLSVSKANVPDNDIDSPFLVEYAEAMFVQLAPDYATFLAISRLNALKCQRALCCYICAQLCKTMANRIMIEVTTIDTKYKKSKVDWEALAEDFMREFEDLMEEINPELAGVINNTLLLVNPAKSTTTT